VYWVTSSTALAGAYKQTWVGVQWKVGGVAWHTSETSAIYPGGEGNYSQNNNGTPNPNCTNHGSVPATPTALTATPDPAFPTSAVDLTWSEGSGDPPSVLPLTYEVEYQSSGSSAWIVYPQNSGIPGTTDTPFVVDNLIPPGTTWLFQVFEVACDGTPSPPTSPATATTSTAVTPPSCQVTNFTVTPSTGATINTGGQLTGSQKYFLIQATVSPACTALAVQYSPTNNGVKVTDAYTGPPPNGSVTWQTTATQWAEGTINFALYNAGTYTNNSLSVTIQCNNGKTC
jgi:hypothetical protein